MIFFRLEDRPTFPIQIQTDHYRTTPLLAPVSGRRYAVAASPGANALSATPGELANQEGES